MPNLTAIILGLLAFVFGFFAARDYLHGGRKFSASAKVWLRIAIIFSVIAVILTVII